MRIDFAPYRDNKRLMDDVFSIEIDDELTTSTTTTPQKKVDIYVSDLFEFYRRACRNDKWPEFLRALSKYTNISRFMKLRYAAGKWSLNLDGFRGVIDNSDLVASMYMDGGKRENKVLPYDDDNKITFVLVLGSVIIFRPPHKYRGKNEKWMRNLEFRVVFVDDGVGDEEEAEVVPVVVVDEGVPVVAVDEGVPVVVIDEVVPVTEAARSSSSALPLRASSSSPNSNTSPAPAPVMTSISASSTSYLAPFVASVLRDQVLVDLLAESKRKDERIQQQEEDRLRLEVTGRNSKPKYYKASMRDGQMTPTGSGFYVFFNRPLLPNFVDKIPRLEVRLGGVNVAPFHQMIAVTMPVERAGFDRTRGNAPQLGRIQFFSNRNDGVQVFGSMGPILPSDYANLPATMAVADLVQFVKHYQAIDGPYISAYMMCYLKILSIFVPTCQINGINFLDTPDKGTTTKNVWGEEKTQVEVIIPAIDVVADADIIDADNGVEEEEAEVVPVALLEEELEVDPAVAVDVDVEETNKDEVAQKDESIIVVPSDEEDGEEEEDDGVELVEEEVAVSTVVDEVVPAVVVDEENTVAPSFEEIRRGMGFSPINNNPTDPVPHDEDLMGWHSPEAPRPNRRSIYDPIQID